MQQSGAAAKATTVNPTTYFSDTAPSWEQLTEMVKYVRQRVTLDMSGCSEMKLERHQSPHAHVPMPTAPACRTCAHAHHSAKAGVSHSGANALSHMLGVCREKQAALGVDFWADPNTGPTNAQALARLFGSTEPPRVKLYRDHAAWCPYCHKV